MVNYYEFDIIPIILKNFNVSDIIFTSLSNEKLVNEVLNYDGGTITAIDMKIFSENFEVIHDYPLNILHKFNNYDAIFIDDDSNWYTIYNELQTIKRTNNKFPLVFICNNRFPNKYRDSYINPKLIPKEYINKYSNNLQICKDNKKIFVTDGFFHALDEKTSNNGVSTAIHDFLVENDDVGILNIGFIEEITVLYLKSPISQMKIDKIFNQIKNRNISSIDLSDKLIENQLLFSYIDQSNISEQDFDNIPDFNLKISENNNLINDYKNKISLHDVELEYKDSQIMNIERKLDLKDSQLKQFEYKLINKDNKISSLENDLKVANDEISSLKNEIGEKENNFIIKVSNLCNQLKDNKNLLDDQKFIINIKDAQIKKNEIELRENKNKFIAIKHQYETQLHRLDNKNYCISCFKEEILNNNFEIDYLKKNSLIKKILNPFSYIYLILKSSFKDIIINIKLFNILKNSKCFDIGYYLSNNKDIINSNWCKYFSPELHYVCHGFSENRKFNKKYFNRNSRKELLEYLLTCEDVN